MTSTDPMAGERARLINEHPGVPVPPVDPTDPQIISPIVDPTDPRSGEPTVHADPTGVRPADDAA